MRRSRVPIPAMVLLAVMLSATSAAAATQTFRALVHAEFEGASPFKGCPTDPTVDFCEIGHVSGYGKVTQVFTFVSGVEVDGCFETTGSVLWTLLDGSGTLTTEEVVLDCTPGNSDQQPGHSFGHPFAGSGTYVISGGTGVFAGASGGGTVVTRSGGDALIITYSGTLTLP